MNRTLANFIAIIVFTAIVIFVLPMIQVNLGDGIKAIADHKMGAAWPPVPPMPTMPPVPDLFKPALVPSPTAMPTQMPAPAATAIPWLPWPTQAPTPTAIATEVPTAAPATPPDSIPGLVPLYEATPMPEPTPVAIHERNETNMSPRTITEAPEVNGLVTMKAGASTYAVLAGLVLLAFMMIGYGVWQLLRKEKEK
jgi:hypothetical protein